MSDESIWNSIKENIKYSLSISSISGVSYVVENKKISVFERCFWVTMIITMAALATWQGLKVYTHYKERPAIVTVDKAYYDWTLQCPSITICLQSLKSDQDLKTFIKELIDETDLSENVLTTEFADFKSYLKDLAFKNFANYEDYEPYAVGAKKEYFKPEQYMKNLDNTVLGLEKLKILQRDAKASRVFTEMGACLVGNPNISIYFTPEHINSTEPYLGNMRIEYTTKITATISAAARTEDNTFIFIHASNEVLDILDRKVIAEPSWVTEIKYNTEIVMTSNDVLPLSVKQKNCRLPYETNEKYLAHSPVYSHNLCLIECRIKLALKFCQCTPYYYRRLVGEPICNLTGLYCLSKYKEQIIHANQTITKCPVCYQNCNIGRYTVFEISGNFFVDMLSELTFMQPNQIYVRNLVFSGTDLIVQIGGVFGLFLGCSLLSIVEIFYSITLRLFCGVRNRH